VGEGRIAKPNIHGVQAVRNDERERHRGRGGQLALVGSAQSLAKFPLWPDIDSFDHVIRINQGAFATLTPPHGPSNRLGLFDTHRPGNGRTVEVFVPGAESVERCRADVAASQTRRSSRPGCVSALLSRPVVSVTWRRNWGPGRRVARWHWTIW
jgi:hypothetical protein